jgi:cyclase
LKRIRIIPSLLLLKDGLYKTVRFNNPAYIGDPINVVKIFNEKGADEIVLLDIAATKENIQINFKKLSEIAGEAFMPMAYGGGIATYKDAQRIFDCGFEKVIINSAAEKNPSLITKIAKTYGAQSAVLSMDVKRDLFGRYRVYTRGGTKNIGLPPVEYAKKMELTGAGEIFLNAIHKDGTWNGYDIEIIKQVSKAVNIPVIASGGASGMDDFKKAIIDGGASAVAAASMFVYQKKGKGVLITFPTEELIL